MLISEVNKRLQNNREEWRNIKNYRVGDIVSVKYQYAGVGLKIRRFIGLCIAKKSREVGSVLLLRNVIANRGVEFRVFIDSNKVMQIQKLNNSRKRVRRSKLYYLRDKPLSKSKVNI